MGHFGVTSGPLWGHFVSTLGLLWGHFGVTHGCPGVPKDTRACHQQWNKHRKSKVAHLACTKIENPLHSSPPHLRQYLSNSISTPIFSRLRRIAFWVAGIALHPGSAAQAVRPLQSIEKLKPRLEASKPRSLEMPRRESRSEINPPRPLTSRRVDALNQSTLQTSKTSKPIS